MANKRVSSRYGGMRKRWWLLRPVDWLYALLPRRTGGGLLLVRMDGIGDMTLFQPYATAYCRALGFTPETTTILGIDAWKQLAPRLFPGFRIDIISERKYEKSLFYRLGVNLRLRRKGYDVVVTSSHFRKLMLHDSLVLATAAPVKIAAQAYRSDRTRREFDWSEAQMTRVLPTGSHPTHECTRHERFLAGLTGQPLPPIPKFLDWKEGDAALPRGRTHVVLNFGSAEPGRNWPLENYLEIAARAIAAGATPVFVGGAQESKASARIDETFAPGEVVNLIGATSLTGLMDVLNSADILVSNETGPGHLGILVGTPTIMIYGGGHAGSFMPYPEDSDFRKTSTFLNVPMDCYGCLWDCKFPRDASDPFRCIASVGVDEVWRAVAERLDSAKLTASGDASSS